MTESRRAPPPWLNTLVFAVAAAALIVAASMVMFSAFMFYDDEGYVLLSLRNFAEHGGLYSDVYTQYGPFPFVLYYTLNLLGLPLTHTAGRLITIAAWGGAAVFCAALVGCATRSLIAKLAVLAAVFAYLWVMASEPTHPGGLIVLLTSALAAAGYRWIRSGKVRAWAIAAGAITAALALTKINVGGFVASSAVAWWLLHHEDERIRRPARWFLPIAATLLPLVLMRRLLDLPWVQSYALVFACSAIAVIFTISRRATSRAGWRILLAGALSGLGVAAVVVAVVFARGTTPADLLEGVLLGPLRQPTNFSLRYLWPDGIRYIGPASLAACAIASVLQRRRTETVDTVIVLFRLLAITALGVHLLRFPDISPDYLVFGFTMPCLWLFVWPLANENAEAIHARAWVGLLLLGQCLHVFPVPGSQIAWSSLLMLPLAAVAGWQAARWLARRFLAERPQLWRSGIWLGRLSVAAFAIAIGWKFANVSARYRDGFNLALPGAELVRLPENSAALYRLLTLNAVAHSDVLFSLPGMFSLNLWSEVATPTGANVTHWFSLLSEDQQQATIRALEGHPRACIVVHREHVNFLAKRGLRPQGPLFDYVEKNFDPAFVLDDFEFSVRRGRSIEPFLLGDIFGRDEAGETSSSPAGENTLLRLALLLPPRNPIARVEVSAWGDASTTPLVLDESNARLEFTRTNFRGEPVAAAQPTPWPLTLEGPAIVSIYYAREGQPRPLRGGLIVLRDAVGNEVGLARLRQ